MTTSKAAALVLAALPAYCARVIVLPESSPAMRIAIASDHAAVALKAELAAWLAETGHTVNDLGPYDTASVDYPDYGFRLAETVASGDAQLGVALCGSGIGISIAVNRHPGARCALVSEPLSAGLAREHNDANVIAMGARLTGPDMARACITAFLETRFAGGRHQRRVDKLSALPERALPVTSELA
jgi:ribose 5-phosphate isomerase B